MKRTTVAYEETPVATRALYGSASVLLLLVGAHALTSGVRGIGEAWSGLYATLAPDLLMGTVVVGFVLLGAAIQRAREWQRRCTASARL